MSISQQNHPSSLQENPNQSGEARYFKQSGLTLIQLMVIFLIVGVLGSTLVNYVLDKRCESEPASSFCNDR